MIIAMENASLLSDAWNNVTTSSSEEDNLKLYLANIRDLALKVVYILTGVVGVLDNLFVIIVFVLFIKITDKVLSSPHYYATPPFIEFLLEVHCIVA